MGKIFTKMFIIVRRKLDYGYFVVVFTPVSFNLWVMGLYLKY